MLPGSGCVAWMMGCMVKSPDRKGDDHGTAAARDVGPGRPRRAGTPLPHHPRRHHPHPLPDAAAARRRPSGPRGRPADLQPPHYPPGWEQELVRVADLDPHEVGVDSALWTCRLLADYLAEQTGHRAGIETVRVALHRAGFVCKRPRWVLSRKAQAQPGWAKNG